MAERPELVDQFRRAGLEAPGTNRTQRRTNRAVDDLRQGSQVMRAAEGCRAEQATEVISRIWDMGEYTTFRAWRYDLTASELATRFPSMGSTAAIVGQVCTALSIDQIEDYGRR